MIVNAELEVKDEMGMTEDEKKKQKMTEERNTVRFKNLETYVSFLLEDCSQIWFQYHHVERFGFKNDPYIYFNASFMLVKESYLIYTVVRYFWNKKRVLHWF